MPGLFSTFDEAAAALAAQGVAGGDPLKLPLAEARARQDKYFAALSRDLPPVGGEENVSIPGPAGLVPLRIYAPEAGAPRGPVVLFIRGAGWWAGGLDSHARTMRLLASLSGCEVCGIDYRRAPEAHYPIQKDEVLAAVRWLSRRAGEGRKGQAQVVLFGESAGATIALSVAQELRDVGEPLLAGMVLFYGNFGGPRDAKRPYSQWVWEQYLDMPERARDPRAVPLLGDMRSLPRTWLGIGERDPLLPDTLELADKLAQAKVDFELARYPDMPHAFVMWTGWAKPAADAVADAAAWARRILQI
jgi:acetyl esterase